MHLLLTSATAFEIRPLLNQISLVEKVNDFLSRYRNGNHTIDVLIPGVGMAFTAFHMGKQLCGGKYDLALNAGICGSFTNSIPIGQVVEVVEDCFSELGAEGKDQFISMFNLGLMDPDIPPYRKGKLINTLRVRSEVVDKLQKVSAITVNTVHGRPESIDQVRDLFNPQTESMEGAAFLYACLLENVPSIQIRSISNYVEERNRAKWNIELALKNLNSVLMRFIKEPNISTR